MMLKIYAYYDKKMGFYSLPVFESQDKDVMVENLIRVLKSGQAKVPAQMLESDLYYLGLYNDKTCEFELLSKPEYLLTPTEFYVAPEVESHA